MSSNFDGVQPKATLLVHAANLEVDRTRFDRYSAFTGVKLVKLGRIVLMEHVVVAT